jgi:hypothetical protein
MDSKLRMKMWTDLNSPKPSWETFKRMLPACDNDPRAVKARWMRKKIIDSAKASSFANPS